MQGTLEGAPREGKGASCAGQGPALDRVLVDERGEPGVDGVLVVPGIGRARRPRAGAARPRSRSVLVVGGNFASTEAAAPS